jgi:CRP/FNR family cyclic AMP-dependent transcriptional regulator
MKDFLRNLELFKAFTDDELDKVSEIIEIRNYDAGEIIIRQGESVGTLFLIKSGSARVSAESGPGQPEEVFAILNPNEYFGELSLVDSHPPAASVYAEENDVIFAIDHKDLRDLMAKNLSIANKILYSLAHTLVQRLRDTDQSLSFARMLMNRSQL